MPTSKSPARKAATKTSSSKKVVNKNKVNAAKPVSVKAADSWSTIHVFGFGESQIIGNKANGKVKNSDLKSLEGLFNAINVNTKKGGKISLLDVQSLNIFNGAFVDFRPKATSKREYMRVSWNDINVGDVKKFANELISKVAKSSGEQVKRPLLKNILLPTNANGSIEK